MRIERSPAKQGVLRKQQGGDNIPTYRRCELNVTEPSFISNAFTWPSSIENCSVLIKKKGGGGGGGSVMQYNGTVDRRAVNHFAK